MLIAKLVSCVAAWPALAYLQVYKCGGTTNSDLFDYVAVLFKIDRADQEGCTLHDKIFKSCHNLPIRLQFYLHTRLHSQTLICSCQEPSFWRCRISSHVGTIVASA